MNNPNSTPALTREHTETFECITCGAREQFDSRTAFRIHMVNVHGLTQMKGTRKMQLHLDTATHFISTYECEVEGVKFFLSTNTERETAFKLRCNKASQKQLNALPPLQP